jgi:hypothetical protein
MAAMIVRAPFITTDDPGPAMARPTMSMLDDCAAPQSAELSSKTAKKARKDHCGLVCSFDHGGNFSNRRLLPSY